MSWHLGKRSTHVSGFEAVAFSTIARIIAVTANDDGGGHSRRRRHKSIHLMRLSETLPPQTSTTNRANQHFRFPLYPHTIPPTSSARSWLATQKPHNQSPSPFRYWHRLTAASTKQRPPHLQVTDQLPCATVAAPQQHPVFASIHRDIRIKCFYCTNLPHPCTHTARSTKNTSLRTWLRHIKPNKHLHRH